MIVKSLRSVQLALALIGFLALASSLATLVPQGREAAYYQQQFSPLAAWLIRFFQVDTFFRSPFFLLPAALFAVNLGLCAAFRLVSRSRAGARARYGPDIIHVGLILLLAGGVITLFGREERTVFLPEGHAVTLPGGGVLKTRALEYQEYPDGRPRDWLTTVELFSGMPGKPGQAAGAAGQTAQAGRAPQVFTIEVNRPLRLGALKVYQSDFYQVPTLAVEEGGTSHTIIPGHGLRTPEGMLRYRTFENEPAAGATAGVAAARGVAVFEEWKAGNRTGERRLAVGESFAGYRIAGMKPFPVTGLRVVRDPGFLPVVAAMLLLGIGLVLTFIQKTREEKNP